MTFFTTSNIPSVDNSEGFFCGCGDMGHTMRVTNEHNELRFSWFLYGKTPWKFWVKQLWNYLRRRDAEIGDFVLKDEDIERLKGLLNGNDIR